MKKDFLSQIHNSIFFQTRCKPSREKSCVHWHAAEKLALWKGEVGPNTCPAKVMLFVNHSEISFTDSPASLSLYDFFGNTHLIKLQVCRIWGWYCQSVWSKYRHPPHIFSLPRGLSTVTIHTNTVTTFTQGQLHRLWCVGVPLSTSLFFSMRPDNWEKHPQKHIISNSAR